MVIRFYQKKIIKKIFQNFTMHNVSGGLAMTGLSEVGYRESLPLANEKVTIFSHK